MLRIGHALIIGALEPWTVYKAESEGKQEPEIIFDGMMRKILVIRLLILTCNSFIRLEIVLLFETNLQANITDFAASGRAGKVERE